MGMIGIEVGRSLNIGVSKSCGDNSKEAQAVELNIFKIAAWMFLPFDDNVSINLCYGVGFVSRHHIWKLLISSRNCHDIMNPVFESRYTESTFTLSTSRQ